jgi:ADP-ribose pyrophosphatase YjhB (NUDIX family)
MRNTHNHHRLLPNFHRILVIRSFELLHRRVYAPPGGFQGPEEGLSRRAPRILHLGGQESGQ